MGPSSRATVKVNGSFPEGFTAPVSTSAREFPVSLPRYQAWTMAATLSAKGIATGLPDMFT